MACRINAEPSRRCLPPLGLVMWRLDPEVIQKSGAWLCARGREQGELALEVVKTFFHELPVAQLVRFGGGPDPRMWSSTTNSGTSCSYCRAASLGAR